MNALLCNSRLRFKHSFSTENNPSHFPYLWFIFWCCSEVQSLRWNLLLSLQNNVFCWFSDYQIKWNKNPREKPSWRRAVERKYLFPASCHRSNKFYWLTEWEMCRRKETQMISKKKRQKLEIYGWMMKRIERKWGEWNFLLGKAAPQSRRAYTSRIALCCPICSYFIWWMFVRELITFPIHFSSDSSSDCENKLAEFAINEFFTRRRRQFRAFDDGTSAGPDKVYTCLLSSGQQLRLGFQFFTSFH